MKKDDLHITITSKPPEFPPELLERIESSHKIIREFGVPAAVAHAAMVSMSGAFVELHKSLAALTEQELLATTAMDKPSLSLKHYTDLLNERKAQQRAQLILLLAFILLTMLVGLL